MKSHSIRTWAYPMVAGRPSVGSGASLDSTFLQAGRGHLEWSLGKEAKPGAKASDERHQSFWVTPRQGVPRCGREP